MFFLVTTLLVMSINLNVYADHDEIIDLLHRTIDQVADMIPLSQALAEYYAGLSDRHDDEAPIGVSNYTPPSRSQPALPAPPDAEGPGPFCHLQSKLYAKYIRFAIGGKYVEGDVEYGCEGATCSDGASTIARCTSGAPKKGIVMHYDHPDFNILEQKGSTYCSPCLDEPGNYNDWTCLGMSMRLYSANDFCHDAQQLAAGNSI